MTTAKWKLRRVWEKMGKPMEATNHLHDTRMFRIAVYGPAIAALLLGTVGYFTSPVDANWTLQGFNNFVTLFKLPIGIAGIAIPFGALIASHHRSIQSASQIDSQQRQNTFSNYIKHKEYFGKYLDDENILSGSNSFAAKDKKVYQALFPNAKYGYLDFAFEWVDRHYIKSLVTSLKEELEKTTWDNRENLPRVFEYIVQLKVAIADEFELEIVDLITSNSMDTLYNQLHNLATTMSQLYSASSFFSENEDTQEIFDWNIMLKVARHGLDEIKEYDYAQQRIKEIALNAVSQNMAPMNEGQKSDLLHLLRKDTDAKLAEIRKSLSELPTTDNVLKQLE